MAGKTQSRKKDHVEIVLKKGAQYSKDTGLDKYDFLHNAVTEADYSSISLSCGFLGRKLKFPLMVTGMTGGYPEAERINKSLAKAAQEHGWMFGLGSQRAMIESKSLAKTFSVRDVAPDVFLVANIGAFQLKRYGTDVVQKLADDVGANALAVHLNALQEIIQPEGDRDFSGILDAIGNACEQLSVPVIAKETGAGMSGEAALRLKEEGVAAIDVSGAGGTSWSKVEYLRHGSIPGFENWGIPTAESITMCRGILPMIASGGVRSGIDAAKCIALGADVAGAAYPFLKALKSGGPAALDKEMSVWEEQIKVCAFLTGSKNYEELKQAKLRVL